MPPTSSPAAAIASTAAAALFGDDILKAGPRKNRKNGVVQGEETKERSGILGHGGADSADHDGNHERQEEQREKQLTRPAGHRHRGEQRTDRGDPDVGKRYRRDELPADRLEEQ